MAHQGGKAISAGVRAPAGEQQISQQRARGKIKGAPMVFRMQNFRRGNAGGSLTAEIPRIDAPLGIKGKSGEFSRKVRQG